uniref:N/A n=1 Tax=Ganoderma boninense TaxID=34458 RepID=A0A5K1K4N1_9APHY|nr:N/A [Ganoderma boninense]
MYCRDSDPDSLQGSHNTVYYNVWAACAACNGSTQPTWADWADNNECKSRQASFPPQVQFDNGVIPNWANQNLTSNGDFNLNAVLQTTPQKGLSRPAQIAVPIAAGVGVALLAGLLFWWYRRRKWRRQRNARMRPLSDGWFSSPRQWLNDLWLRAHSTRLKTSKKEASWEIDDEEQYSWRSAYRDPYSPPAHSQMHELGAVRPSHNREASNSTLLSHIEFPTVHRVPTFLERFIKFKDGIRKSATYKAKYVSAISPDHTFRIDGSAADSPIVKKFDDHALDETTPPSKSSSDPEPSFQPHRVSTVREEEEDTPGGTPVIVDRADLPMNLQIPRYPAEFPSEVLVISRDGQDFALDDMSTAPPTSLPTPTVARQVSTCASPTFDSIFVQPRLIQCLLIHLFFRPALPPFLSLSPRSNFRRPQL